jgi:hypothetical protein
MYNKKSRPYVSLGIVLIMFIAAIGIASLLRKSCKTQLLRANSIVLTVMRFGEASQQSAYGRAQPKNSRTPSFHADSASYNAAITAIAARIQVLQFCCGLAPSTGSRTLGKVDWIWMSVMLLGTFRIDILPIRLTAAYKIDLCLCPKHPMTGRICVFPQDGIWNCSMGYIKRKTIGTA